MARWNRSSIYVNVTSAPALPDVHLIDICIFMCMAKLPFCVPMLFTCLSVALDPICMNAFGLKLFIFRSCV